MHSIDLAIVGGFLIICLGIGLWAGRGIKDIREYAIANKSYGTLALVLTYLATDIGGGAVFSHPKEVFSNGIIMTIALSGIAISHFFRAIFIAPRMSPFKNCITLGDVMGTLYGKNSKIITGILSLFHATMMTGMQLTAIGFITQKFLGIQGSVGVIVAGLIIALYTAFGGIKSVTATDIFQFIMLVVTIPVIGIIAVGKIGGMSELLSKVPASKFDVFGNENFSYYLTFFVMWGVLSAEMMDPAMMLRMLMAKNEKQLRSLFYTVGAVDISFRLLIMVIGLAGVVLYPTIQVSNLIPHMVNDLIPEVFKGFMVVGFLSVVLSTADSHMHVAGLSFVHDIIQPLCQKSKRNIDELAWAKYGTILVSVFAILVGLLDMRMLQFSFIARGAVVPIIAFPLLLGIFKVKPNKTAFYASLFAAMATFGATILILPAGKKHLCVLGSTLVSGLIFILVNIFKSKNPGVISRHNPALSNNITPQAQTIFSPINQIIHFSEHRVNKYGAPYVLFGVFACINFILPCFLWEQSYFQAPYLLLGLRVIGLIMCTLLIVKDKWPRFMLPFLPTFWHITIMYCLPFMGTVMFLSTSGNLESLLNVAFITILLTVLVDWVSFLFICVLGIWLGLEFCAKMDLTEVQLSFNTWYLLGYQIILGTIIGLLFARRKQQTIDTLIDKNTLLEGERGDATNQAIEALTYQDRVSKSLGMDGIEVLEEMQTTSDRLKEIADKDKENQELVEISAKVAALNGYVKGIAKRAKEHIKLNKTIEKLNTLLDKVEATAKLQGIEVFIPREKEETNEELLKKTYKETRIGCDQDLIVKMLKKAIEHANRYNLNSTPVQVQVTKAVLSYKIESVPNYTKKISALCIAVSTEENLDVKVYNKEYNGDIYRSVMVPPENEHDLAETTIKRIIDAHCGVMATIVNHEGCTKLYVIPARVKDIRIDPLDQNRLPETLVTYPSSLEKEEELIAKLKERAPAVDLEKVHKSIALIKKYHGDTKRKSGEPFYLHPVEVAKKLLDHRDKEELVLAALLHDTVEDVNGMELDKVRAMYGDKVADYVYGVTKYSKKEDEMVNMDRVENVEKLKKQDPDTLCLKVCDRWHNMSTIQGHSYEKQRDIAEETQMLFIPIAEDLGMNTVAEEMRGMVFDTMHRLAANGY